MTKFESVSEDFYRALDRFREVLREEETDIVRDSAIKRFEIVFELGWKTLKAFLEEYHNNTCVSPRACFRAAFSLGLLEYEESYWIALTSMRNYTIHTYREAFAKKIYRQLPEALVKFDRMARALKKQP